MAIQKDYSVTLVGDEVHVISPTTKDIIIGGRYIFEFMVDKTIIDLLSILKNQSYQVM